MHYYSSRLMIIRVDPNNSTAERRMQVLLHSFRKLFHQYIADQYAKIEQQRRNFIRYNQQTLRAKFYSTLITNMLRLDDNSDMSAIDPKVISPSTFVGGPRLMAQLYQNAMNLVLRFGKHDLFITLTCNPAWPEIANELLIRQRPSDRPALCARVFHLKLQALLNDIVKKSVLGKVEAYCYYIIIKFQKRGLPYYHMLFILKEDDKKKPTTAAEIDCIVSAKLPNPVTHLLAYETVTATSMVRGGPCGDLNPEAQYMRNSHCTKRYFSCSMMMKPTLVIDAQRDGLNYRRTVMPGGTILRNNGRIRIDNCWIEPHNSFLASKYYSSAHINVEICNNIPSVSSCCTGKGSLTI